MAERICARAAMTEEALWKGTMDEAQARELAAHAESCSECANVMEGVAAAKRGLAALKDEEIPVPSADAAWSRVEKRLGERRPGWGRSYWMSTAAAAGLLIVIGGGVMVALGGPARRMFTTASSTEVFGSNQASLSAGIYGDESPAPAMDAAKVEPEYREADRIVLARGQVATEQLSGQGLRPGVDGLDNSVGEVVPVVPPRVERGAEMTLGVPDARDAFKRVTGIVSEAGGRVITSRVEQPRGSERAEARLVVKIPVARFDGVIADLHAMGRVLAENIAGEDRTSQYQDVEGRLRDRDAAIEALRQRLARGNIGRDEVKRIENELARARQEREAAENARRGLAARTDFATLEIRLAEEEPRPGSVMIFAGRFFDPIADALDVAAGLFAGGLSVIVIGVGACLPWALLGWATWSFLRRRALAW